MMVKIIVEETTQKLLHKNLRNDFNENEIFYKNAIKKKKLLENAI